MFNDAQILNLSPTIISLFIDTVEVKPPVKGISGDIKYALKASIKSTQSYFGTAIKQQFMGISPKWKGFSKVNNTKIFFMAAKTYGNESVNLDLNRHTGILNVMKISENKNSRVRMVSFDGTCSKTKRKF